MSANSLRCTMVVTGNWPPSEPENPWLRRLLTILVVCLLIGKFMSACSVARGQEALMEFPTAEQLTESWPTCAEALDGRTRWLVERNYIFQADTTALPGTFAAFFTPTRANRERSMQLYLLLVTSSIKEVRRLVGWGLESQGRCIMPDKSIGDFYLFRTPPKYKIKDLRS